MSQGDQDDKPTAEQLAASIETESINKQRRYFLIGATATVGAVGIVGAGVGLVQLGLGVVNVLLAAPVWMQLVHLLVADVIWILWILLGLAALAPSVGGSAQT